MSGVVVAYGGASFERAVSLSSGRRASRALAELGYEVSTMDVGPDFIDAIEATSPDFVFIALHGSGGEDGVVQDILEILKVPYTGSDALSSALCFDKHLFKTFCALRDIPTPSWHSFTKHAFEEYGVGKALHAIMSGIENGLVVKPCSQGSSLGITVVQNEDALHEAILAAMNYGDRVLLEQYIEGRELAVTVIGPPDRPEVLPVVELIFDDPIYSFEAHYEIGSAVIRDATLPTEIDRQVKDVAARAYSASGCRDFARVDIRFDGAIPWVLEINTIPGLTETGPTPVAADIADMSFQSLIGSICSRVAAR